MMIAKITIIVETEDGAVAPMKPVKPAKPEPAKPGPAKPELAKQTKPDLTNAKCLSNLAIALDLVSGRGGQDSGGTVSVALGRLPKIEALIRATLEKVAP